MANTPEQDLPIEENRDQSELSKIRRKKLQELQESGHDPFKSVKFSVDSSTEIIKNDFEGFEGKTVSIAGRIISFREMGKASFCDLLDRSGKIQLYVRLDEVGADSYNDFKKMDIGDIIGVTGIIFKTHKGEISIKTKTLELLAKSLLPLPEKWHGLRDMDLRYRQRYVDLIVSPEVRKTFFIRTSIMKEIRRYLDGLDFLEVETPLLNVIPGGAAARPFVTHHNTLDIDLYLRISPELHLKRLIVGGLEKVYEIGRCFRNEGISIKHNPEFSLLELYQAYTDYNGMAELTEGLISALAEKVTGTFDLTYQELAVNMKPPWSRLTMVEAVKIHTGADFGSVSEAAEAAALASSVGMEVKKGLSWGEILYAVFEVHVEKKLLQPTFILDYPIEVSPLTKRRPDDPRLTERFELFIAGREMANAYSELNDPSDQRERFLAQVQKREAGDEEANMMDEDYINALEYGMPPAGGLGIGIDRLVMLLTDSYSIRDVLLFPTMKPRE